MISMKSKFKRSWDVFIIVCAIYNSFMVPFDFAFKSETEKNNHTPIADMVIDVLFFVDILLMFFTSTISRDGFETYDSVYIRNTYIKTFRFKIDFLSLFGIRYLQRKNWVFTICSLMKMFRVLRISKMITTANTNIDIKATLNLTKVMFYLIFFLHIITCLWWLVICQSAPIEYHWDE